MQDIKDKVNDEPATLPSLGDQRSLIETVQRLTGRRVRVSGRYLHDREVLVGPRSAPPGLMGAPAQGLATNPQGYFVITPLQRDDGTLVFMNRGWVSVGQASWLRPGLQPTDRLRNSTAREPQTEEDYKFAKANAEAADGGAGRCVTVDCVG
jgi:cytochrome oxidase assembly protein ShyY1